MRQMTSPFLDNGANGLTKVRQYLLHLLGTATLYVALVLSVVSAGQYLVEAWKEFFKKG